MDHVLYFKHTQSGFIKINPKNKYKYEHVVFISKKDFDNKKKELGIKSNNNQFISVVFKRLMLERKIYKFN